jgi:P27 family predicted phage terminase small subunit
VRGRKPKPTAQKELAGNPGKRALNKDEPEVIRLTSADPPSWLNKVGREAWKWYAPRLIQARTLGDVDLHNLEAFCAAYSRWRLAELDIKKNGITVRKFGGGRQKNPAATIANEALKQMATFGAALGLDPSSRSRIKVPGGQGKNPFKELDG